MSKFAGIILWLAIGFFFLVLALAWASVYPSQATNALKIGGVVAGIVALLWVFIQIVKSGKGLPIFFLLGGVLFFLFTAYQFIYSDKNGDGAADVQIVRVVQPDGSDPTTDLTYSQVNQNNSKANSGNAFTFFIYSGTGLLVMIFFAVIGMFLFLKDRAGT